MIKSGVNPWYEIKLAEGRQNQIRVMFQNFGRLVEKLRRVKIRVPGSGRPTGALSGADAQGNREIQEAAGSWMD